MMVPTVYQGFVASTGFMARRVRCFLRMMSVPRPLNNIVIDQAHEGKEGDLYAPRH
jgi:hypothetical protein